MNYEISFIIPVFNKKPLQLRHCIDSILQIKNKKFEIVIIDDGSISQNSKEYREIAKIAPNIKYFFEKNKGVSQARNTGLKQSSGKYVFFVDADDEVIIDPLNKVNLRSEKNELIIFDVEKIDVHTHSITRYNLDKNKSISKDILLIQMLKDGLLNWVYAKLYLRKWLIQNLIVFDVSRKIGEDLDFVSKVIEKATKIEYINQVVYRYLFSSDTGLDRILRFPEENIKDIYLIYKLRENIINQLIPYDLNNYEVLLKEKAIDGLFAIYKNLAIRDYKKARACYSVLNRYLNLLGNVKKASLKNRIKILIIKKKIFIIFFYMVGLFINFK